LLDCRSRRENKPIPLFCLQLHWFASLAARLFFGLVACGLQPPLTPPKRAHWPRNQTNNAAPREAQQNKRKSKLISSIFHFFFICSVPLGGPRKKKSKLIHSSHSQREEWN